MGLFAGGYYNPIYDKSIQNYTEEGCGEVFIMGPIGWCLTLPSTCDQNLQKEK